MYLFLPEWKEEIFLDKIQIWTFLLRTVACYASSSSFPVHLCGNFLTKRSSVQSSLLVFLFSEGMEDLFETV